MMIKRNLIHFDDKPQNTKFDGISPNSRSFVQRTFGKIEPGAVRAGIFTLMSSMIGAACLTLPLVFLTQGIILGFILLILSSFCAYLGIIYICEAANKYQIYEYSALVEKVLGKKWKIVLDFCVVVYSTGVVTGLQVMTGFFVPSIFSSLNISFNPNYERIIIMSSACILIMIPLGFLQKLTSLRFASLLSTLTIIFITLLIVCEFPYYSQHNSYSNIKYFELNISVISSFNICLYTFTCHSNVAQVYDELQKRSLRRMGKVAKRAIVFVLIPFTLLSLFGYLSSLDDTPKLIIMRRAPRHISNDWLMVLARVLMSISLIISVPINLVSGRNIIIKKYLRVKEDIPPKKVHYPVVVVVLVLTLIIAIVYPNILVLFSFLGGFCCGIFVLVIPGFLKVKTEEWDDRNWKAVAFRVGPVLLFLTMTAGALIETIK